MIDLYGWKIQIMPLSYIGEPYTTRAKTHKKKRIDKKWLKRYGYITKYKDDHKILNFGKFLYMSEGTYRMIKESMKEKQE